MFQVTAVIRGKCRLEASASPGEALTWAEEFRFLGGTQITVRYPRRMFTATELADVFWDQLATWPSELRITDELFLVKEFARIGVASVATGTHRDD